MSANFCQLTCFLFCFCWIFITENSEKEDWDHYDLTEFNWTDYTDFNLTDLDYSYDYIEFSTDLVHTSFKGNSSAPTQHRHFVYYWYFGTDASICAFSCLLEDESNFRNKVRNPVFLGFFLDVSVKDRFIVLT